MLYTIYNASDFHFAKFMVNCNKILGRFNDIHSPLCYHSHKLSFVFSVADFQQFRIRRFIDS